MIKGLIILICINSTYLIADTIYKYKNADGITVYSDVKPDEKFSTENIKKNDLPPLLITQPEKIKRENKFKNSFKKPTQNRSYQSPACLDARRKLEWVKKEIKRRTGTWTIEQLRDGKRKYTELKHKHCI
jgi:hypothetical protein